MNLIEIVLTNCREVAAYLVNKVRYLRRNKNDQQEIVRIKSEIQNDDISFHILKCAMENESVRKLAEEFYTYVS